MNKQPSPRRRFFHPIVPPPPPAVGRKPLAFDGTTRAALADWQRRMLREFRAALGPEPRRAPLRPQMVERRVFPDYVREKLVFDVEADLSVAAWLCRPRKISAAKHPAVLCCHGPGPGKDPLIGRFQGEGCLEYHKLVSVRLAQAGYITLTPDRRGHGDCSGFAGGYPTLPYLADLDSHYLRTRGASLLALDIRDNLRVADLLGSWVPGVDRARIGCLGMEAGAVVAAAVAALHPSVRTACLGAWMDDAPRFPGPSQIPALTGRAGPVEICGLICPKPIQVQIHRADCPVPPRAICRAVDRIRRFYRRAGSPENFQPHVFDGVVELDYPAANAWLDQQMK